RDHQRTALDPAQERGQGIGRSRKRGGGGSHHVNSIIGDMIPSALHPRGSSRRFYALPEALCATCAQRQYAWKVNAYGRCHGEASFLFHEQDIDSKGIFCVAIF